MLLLGHLVKVLKRLLLASFNLATYLRATLVALFCAYNKPLYPPFLTPRSYPPPHLSVSSLVATTLQIKKFCEKNFIEYTFTMGFKLSLVLGGLLAASLTGSWFLFNQLSQAKANQIVLESKVSEQNDSIKQYLAKQEQLSADLGKLETDKQNALREVNKLRQTFAKHDLDNLALNKPGLVEKIVNKGSKKVMDNLVAITTVKEDETATN